MTRREVGFFTLCLVLMGAGWGLTMPLTKIAVSTGYGHNGLLFWQLVLSVILMGCICVLRRLPLPLTIPALRLYLILAMVGTVMPNSISYQAAVHLPAGIMSLLLTTIPMFGFAIALTMGTDGFAWKRFGGLALGLAGVLVIVAPGADLGQEVPLFWAGAYLVVATFYGFESNYIAKYGTLNLGPFQVMLGASLVGLAFVLPAMLITGHWIAPQWPMPEAQGALVLSSVAHVLVYASYVWLAGRAGAVFTVQVSYLVTAFGLLWARWLLGEAYTALIWVALALIFAGMFLVQPRPRLTSDGAVEPSGR